MSTNTLTKSKIKVKKPSLYNVILHNDDVTPFNYVIMILMSVFSKTYEEAEVITMSIHETKGGVAGTYAKEIAEEKVKEINTINSTYTMSLKSSIEKE